MHDLSQFATAIPAFDFARKAFEMIEAAHEQQCDLRHRGSTKQLVEEVLPIATFAKAFEAPQRHLNVRYDGTRGSADAEMFVRGACVDDGIIKPRYYLEVTSAIAEYEYLQREALARHGTVHGGPNIRRIGSRREGTDDVESTAMVRHLTAVPSETQRWVESAIRNKTAKEYPEPCMLLVRVEPDGILSPHDWCEVAIGARDAARSSRFAGVYLVYTSTGLVYEV